MGEAKRKREQFRAKPRPCAYCGAPAATRDHVPPRAAFSKPYPFDLITVPCCQACNARYSKLDEEFSIGLSLLAGERTQQSQKLFYQHTIPVLRKNKRLRQSVVSQMGEQPIWLPDPSSGQFRQFVKVEWPSDTHHEMIERITRGLYFTERARRLADFSRIADRISRLSRKALSNSEGIQFEYAFMRAEESPVDTLWLYIFHGAECATAATGRLAEDLPSSQNADLNDD